MFGGRCGLDADDGFVHPGVVGQPDRRGGPIGQVDQEEVDLGRLGPGGDQGVSVDDAHDRANLDRLVGQRLAVEHQGPAARVAARKPRLVKGHDVLHRE